MIDTENPIETLRKAVYRYHDLSHASAGKAFPEHCLMEPCADARAALEDVEALVAALWQRCSNHRLPIEFEPQGDAQYPLTGWFHPIAGKPSKVNRSGIVYAKCGLTDDERTVLVKFQERHD